MTHSLSLSLGRVLEREMSVRSVSVSRVRKYGPVIGRACVSIKALFLIEWVRS